MSEEAKRLLAALDSAKDDAARAALLAGQPDEVLQGLHVELKYRQLTAEIAATLAAERAAFEAFTAELDAAPDDDARLKIIEEARRDPRRGAAFVSEWAWQRTATTADWAARFFALIRPEGAP